MPFSLTVEDIRKNCGSSFFARGKTYQRQGRVLVSEWDEETQILFGEVRGSGRKVYGQDILLAPNRRDRFHGYCSCPVGENCKHVVAVLLEWMEVNADASPSPLHAKQASALQLWQQQTDQQLHNATEDEYPEPGQPCLLYLLQPQKSNSKPGINLQTVRSRRLKKGGWGKHSTYNLNELNGYYYAPAGVLPLDREIAQLLSPQDSFYDSRLVLEGDIGLLALQRLLSSRRCFLKSSNNPPLTAGPNRKASFSWHEQNRQTRLEISLEGCRSWRLIPTEPLCYLDAENHQCGTIEQPLPGPLFASLCTLPPAGQDELRELSYFLLQKLPPEAMPLPVELKVNRCDQPPVKQLILHAVSSEPGRRHHLARVRFVYGPLSLPPHFIDGQETILVEHAGEDWQIVRHPEDEAMALETLAGYNFIPAQPPLGTPDELDLLFATNSLEESALSWKCFLEELPDLEAAGWRVYIDPSFSLSFETIDTLQADIDEEGHGWFEIGLNIEHDGQSIPLLPLLVQWLESQDPGRPLLLNLEGNRWLEIPPSILEPVVGTLVELFQDPQLSAAGRLSLPQPQAHGLLQIEESLNDGGHQLEWQGGKKLRRLAEKLRNFQGIEPVAAPAALQADLRNYQQQGLAWLQFLREYEFNGVLADDMGLGKTVQTLAHLLHEKEAGRLDRPALIVAPTSVLSNWRREAARFTPGLTCLLLHGPQRAGDFDHVEEYDLIVTSYALLTRDLEQHLKHHYHSLILDEAQAIKNPRAKSAQAACTIKASHRLCLTGTPLENHLGELWSLFQFLMPGFLGQQKQFNQLFRTPIEKHRDHSRQQQLQQRLAPFILRRDKSQVVRELPTKTLMVREVELDSGQAKLYESLRLAMTDRIGRLLQEKGLKNSHIEILDALLKLRQACCDPRLVKLESARKVKHSAKLDLLMEMLQELVEEGRKVLIFSQFTSMLGLIEEELRKCKIAYSKLTGRTRKREAAIASFQEGEAPVFLISLKAGGVGLNLTAADTVIHYDPWWNPAVENQATDRAHRIGQEKPVFVYKLVARGTVEEKILQLQQKKQELADGVYKQNDHPDALPGVSSEEILSLLEPVG